MKMQKNNDKRIMREFYSKEKISVKTGRLFLCLLIMLLLCSCGKKTTNNFALPEKLGNNLVLSRSMELQYATEFLVGYYVEKTDSTKQSDLDSQNTNEQSANEQSSNEYIFVMIHEEPSMLILPETVDEIPQTIKEGLPSDITVIKHPQRIYLVASQVMEMMVAIESLEDIRFSGVEAEGWYVEEAREKMEAGELLYAGKYSSPDYEMIVDQHCDFVIENTMIYHDPTVREKLESFSIPVMVDRSSYEKEPLGRTEWVKLYGAITGHENLANEVYNQQLTEYTAIQTESISPTPTVAFFYISANGEVKVRKSEDYLPKMIAMAGGEYIFKDLGTEDDNAMSTVTLQMEEFYATAKDADYIIYNSTTVGELESLEDLLTKSPLLKDFRAVQNGNVYCTSSNLFQATMQTGTIISDIHKMFFYDESMVYLFELK